MTIEFLMDEFQEGGKKEIDKIVKTVQQKPKADGNTVFLKKFTLSLLGQYNKPKRVIKQDLQSKDLQSSEMKSQIQQRILAQPPSLIRMEEFMPLVPKPFYLLENIPSPQLKSIPAPKSEEKRELPQSRIITRPIKPEMTEMKIPEAPRIMPAPRPLSRPSSNLEVPKPEAPKSLNAIPVPKPVNEAPKPI